MFRKPIPWLIVVGAAAVTAVTATPASADVIIPIGADQHFEGLVNGKVMHATIATVNCHLVGLGAVANPAPGQHVKVVLNPTSDGYTGGRANAVDVYLPPLPVVPSQVASAPVVLHNYNQPVAIPVTMEVPCSGPGQVQFVPDPTSSTAVTETVDVTLVPVLPPPAM